MSAPAQVGVVGLGNMGWEIAAVLASGGHQLYVSDVRPAVEKDFVSRHPDTQALTGRWGELDVLVLVLPNSDIVDAVVAEALTALRAGSLVIDMSSSDPARTLALAAQVQARGVRFVDAPVSGGVVGARERRLAILLGGSSEDVAEARRLVSPMATSMIHVGDVGAGHAAKALNNLVSAGGLSLTAEALHAAEAFGIDRAQMLAVLNSSSGRTNTSENKVAQFIFSGTFGSGFSQHLMAKDIAIAVGLTKTLGVPHSVSERVHEQWTKATQLLDATADHTEMYRILAVETGSENRDS